MSVEFIDHTADVRVRITAKDYKQLFSEAVKSIFLFIAPGACKDNKKLDKKYNVKITSPNYETLLVDFMSEILYLVETEFIVICKTNMLDLKENFLHAELIGYKYDKDFEEHIKAITYEKLNIVEHKNELVVEITFDI